jgi:hypothetical protein
MKKEGTRFDAFRKPSLHHRRPVRTGLPGDPHLRRAEPSYPGPLRGAGPACGFLRAGVQRARAPGAEAGSRGAGRDAVFTAAASGASSRRGRGRQGSAVVQPGRRPPLFREKSGLGCRRSTLNTTHTAIWQDLADSVA